jgi:hypothetical protein
MAHAVNLINLDRHPFAFDQLLQVHLGFLAIGLAGEFIAFRGLWRIDPLSRVFAASVYFLMC